MAPNAEVEDIINVTSSHSKAHSLKAAIFHTMAYKLSLEINNNKITPKSLIAFLKVLYNVAQIKKKRITVEQYSRIHVAGPKIAICETASNVVFVLNSPHSLPKIIIFTLLYKKPLTHSMISSKVSGTHRS